MKRYLSFFISLVILLGTFSLNVSAADGGEIDNYAKRPIYTSNGYNLVDNSGPYLKISAVCKQINQTFLFVSYKKYVSSVYFEIFEDKEQTVCIASYHTSEWETWFQKDIKSVINHDAALKEENVYDLICEVIQLDYEVAVLKPACASNDNMQAFLVNECVIELANSSSNAFNETVNEIVDDFYNDIQDTVESSLVGTAVSCVKEIREINENAYESPYKKHWFEVLVDWILAYSTSDKPSAPDVPKESVLGQAYAEVSSNALNKIGKINFITLDRLLYEFTSNEDSNFAIYKKHYEEILKKAKSNLPNKHSNLCDIIIELDSDNK